MRLWCRLVGHRWDLGWAAPWQLSKLAVACFTCKRCGMRTTTPASLEGDFWRDNPTMVSYRNPPKRLPR